MHFRQHPCRLVTILGKIRSLLTDCYYPERRRLGLLEHLDGFKYVSNSTGQHTDVLSSCDDALQPPIMTLYGCEHDGQPHSVDLQLPNVADRNIAGTGRKFSLHSGPRSSRWLRDLRELAIAGVGRQNDRRKLINFRPTVFRIIRVT